MPVLEEVLAKSLEYKVRNQLTTYLQSIKSEWLAQQTLGSIIIPADVVELPDSISNVIISGWEGIDRDELFRAGSFPVVYCFVTEVTTPSIFEQQSADTLQFACAIKVIDQASERAMLEKKVYRYVDAIYRMMRNDIFIAGSGYSVQNLSKAYSATEPTTPLIKAGQVSFIVSVPDVL